MNIQRSSLQVVTRHHQRRTQQIQNTHNMQQQHLFKLLKRSDTLSIIFSFVDLDSLLNSVVLTNKEFFKQAMISIESLKFGKDWNEAYCKRIAQQIMNQCKPHLRHLSVKNGSFPGNFFRLEQFPNIRSLELLKRLNDNTDLQLLAKALLINGDDLNPRLTKIDFNLDNFRSNTLSQEIVAKIGTDGIRCRHLEEIRFQNSFNDPVLFATLLYHILTGSKHSEKYMLLTTKSLTLCHFSNMDSLLGTLAKLVKASGHKIRLEQLVLTSCRDLNDHQLSLLTEIFDNDVLRVLHLVQIYGNLTVRNGWEYIFSHFNRIRDFNTDSFVLGSATLHDSIQWTNGAFSSLAMAKNLETLCINFYKFRENLRDLKNDYRDMYGAELFNVLVRLTKLRSLTLSDLGELLNQEKLEQSLTSNRVTKESFAKLQRLKIDNAKVAHFDSILKLIHSSIEQLHIEYCFECKSLVADPDQMPQFPQLHSLRLNNMKHMTGTLKFIAEHMNHKLTTLELSKSSSISDYKYFTALKDLKVLQFSHFELFDDQSIKYLSTMTQLEVLHMTSMKKLHGSGFKDLLTATENGEYQPVMPKLRILRLDWCKNLTDELFTHLQWFTSIQTFVTIDSDKLTDFHLLGKLVNLEELRLNRVPFITDDMIMEIATNARNITKLHINGANLKFNANLTRKTLQAISQLRQLQSLELNFCGKQLDNSGVKYMAALKYNLKVCRFLRCPALSSDQVRKVVPFTNVIDEHSRLPNTRRRLPIVYFLLIIPAFVALLSLIAYRFWIVSTGAPEITSPHGS